MTENTKNFKVSEFACKCGCQPNKVQQSIINLCQKIRDKAGIPIRVNSGYRCEKHNAKVGGVKGSQHTLGLAADLSCAKGAKYLLNCVMRLYDAGEIPELQFCKEYKSWIHVDCGKKRNRVFDLLK
ncbi:MAG: hypothetical protein IJ597_05205 [Synergistaceae bacterium]|nr:hypothetical protein [Synergistaceae bacterium]